MDTPQTQVLFDNYLECQIISQSYTELVCLAPKYGKGDGSDAGANNIERVVSVQSALSGPFHQHLNNAKFWYKKSETPSISQISILGGNTYSLGTDRKRRSTDEVFDIIEAGTVIEFVATGLSDGEVQIYLNDVLCEITDVAN